MMLDSISQQWYNLYVFSNDTCPKGPFILLAKAKELRIL
jgi:hypothetical protein